MIAIGACPSEAEAEAEAASAAAAVGVAEGAALVVPPVALAAAAAPLFAAEGEAPRGAVAVGGAVPPLPLPCRAAGSMIVSTLPDGAAAAEALLAKAEVEF